MENNKVSVKIYGQEYTISGDASREHIIKVADYVDTKMHEISQAASGAAQASIAVLSAVNISDEIFTLREENEELRAKNAQLEKDIEHYVQLWDEAKRNFMQYKEETSNMSQQKDELIRSLNEKELEISELKGQASSAQAEAHESAAAEIEELRSKCKELENNFFDLQMENIRLKSEVERQKR